VQKSPWKSLQPLLVALLLTVGFVACGSSRRSLNTNGVGDGGEEGATPGAGTGGSPSAGKGSGDAGNLISETGGGPSAGSPQGGSAGLPNGGVPNGGVGATAGFAGSSGGGSGPVGGSTGVAGSPCNSSDGTGCDEHGFCVDNELDTCAPDFTSACSGTCAAPYRARLCAGPTAAPCPRDFECLPDFETLLSSEPGSLCVGGRPPGCETSDQCSDGFTCWDSGNGENRCLPYRANCAPLPDACDEPIPSCPAGYAAADAHACDYVCVAIQHCACESDDECPAPSVCDRVLARCSVPIAPAPRCSQPFDPGPCDALVPAFAFVGGECQPVVYGGCQGNDNVFSTNEECLAACEGRPLEQECRGGRTPAVGCLACAGGVGCTQRGAFCFEGCTSDDDCTTTGFSCGDGICQAVDCQ
jgi:hypothetical protein